MNERLEDALRRNTVAFEGVMDAVADLRGTIAEMRQEFEFNRSIYGDLRHFVRDIVRRSEVVHRELVGEIRELRAETRAGTREILSRLPAT
jgi:hypothetical protein